MTGDYLNEGESPLSTLAQDGFYNTSQDYERLYELICQGYRVPGWVDNRTMQDEQGKPYRDLCEVRRYRPYYIHLSVRGTTYGQVLPFMEEEGAEKDLFVRECQHCNLQWIDPRPDT